MMIKPFSCFLVEIKSFFFLKIKVIAKIQTHRNLSICLFHNNFPPFFQPNLEMKKKRKD